MNLKKEDLLLYAVTDRSWLNGQTLYEQVEQALQGGVTMVQLRDKQLTEEGLGTSEGSKTLLQEAVAIRKLCAKYQVPFIVNDSVEIAKKIDADGVHVGQSDRNPTAARAILGLDKIIGVSARTPEQALLAQSQGADYIGVGAAFQTGTKQDAKAISHEQLKAVCNAVSIPAVAIGGITNENLLELSGTGISGIAVVSAIFARKDLVGAARELKETVRILQMDEAANGSMDAFVNEFISGFIRNELITGMIFDVDGTILDSMPVWDQCAQRYLSDQGITPNGGLEKELFSMTMQQGVEYMKETYGLVESVEDIIYGMNEIVAVAYQTDIKIKPKILPFLTALHAKGVPMAVVTSTDRPLILAAFQRLEILQYFNSIITCSEFGAGKDDPEIFYAAADRIGSSPKSTWVVEDALYAIRTAKAAGFKVIGVADASSRSDEVWIRRLSDYYISNL